MVRDTVRYKQYCTKPMPSFVGGTLGRASDDERSKSFKMVRDTVRYKQYCTKTIPKHELRKMDMSKNLHISSSKSFKMVRDTVCYKQFGTKTIPIPSFETHTRH